MTGKKKDSGPAETKAVQITGRIMDWYAGNKRDLPWRRTRDPYRIWVSEIMLQQTQVTTVIPYYQAFTTRFPTVEALAAASEDRVLKSWENLGYYARARNMHRAAKIMIENYGGKIPNSWDRLIALPGIGPYVAGAVLSIAFEIPVPAVDGNARRVLSRLFAVEAPLNQGPTQRRLGDLAEALLPVDNPGDFNQGLIELGAMLCTPKKPSCGRCPLQPDCRAYSNRMQDLLPVKSKRKPLPHFDITAGVIRDEDRVLVARRPSSGLLGGLWKWPGGRLNPGEDLTACLRRTVLEEVGLRVRVGRPLARVKHQYTHFRITLHAFHCRLLSGRPSSLTCADWRWEMPERLSDLAFSKADREIAKAVIAGRG